MRLRNGNLCLVGFMGSGKDTVGKIVAERMDIPFVNTDERVVQHHAGMSIDDIFRIYDEPHFRQIEKEMVRKVCSKHGQLISPGGGAFCQEDDELRTVMLENSHVLWLDVGLHILRERLKNKTDRPLAKDPVKMEALFWERRPFYAKAHFTVRVDIEVPAEEVAQRVLQIIS